MSKVVIAIPSFRRPKGLARLLDAIAALQTDADVTVLVADNDAENHEATDVCVQYRAHYRWALDSIVVPERGIASVRNALVAQVLAHHDCDFVAMIDDDEVPEPTWLAEHLRMQKETDADAVGGTIRRVFETDPGAWAARCDGVSDVIYPSGVTAMLEGTGNLLLKRDLLKGISAPWF